MLKRELKVNRKSLILWTLIVLLIFLVVFLVYPSIMNSDGQKQIDEMMKIFPPEMLKAFNMDIASISSVFGWFKTEGQIFMLLIGGTYSAILGSSILLKEESDKTIEFLATKPISRNKIVTSKILCGVINILILSLAVTVFNLIGMALSNDLELESFLWLHLSPILIYLVFFFVSLAISTFFRSTKQTLGIGIGITFISYFLQMIGTMAKEVEFLKYFSIFELASSRYIITNGCVHPLAIVIVVLLIGLSMAVTYRNYNKKEFFV